MNAEAPKTSVPGQSKMVPLYCNQCVCGIDFSSTDRRAVHILELSDDDWFGHKMLWAMTRSQ